MYIIFYIYIIHIIYIYILYIHSILYSSQPLIFWVGQKNRKNEASDFETNKLNFFGGLTHGNLA